MKRLFLAALLLCLPEVAKAADLLVSPAWLKAHIDDKNLVLFHVGAPADFAKEHIAGAQLVSPADLSIPRAEGALILQLLPPDALREKLQSLGLSDDSRVIVYFGADWISPTTRVYFSLDAAGLGENASVLDGGMPAWKAAGGGVTGEVSPPRLPGRITAKPRADLVASLEAVRAGISEPGLRIIDARAPEFYEGRSPGSMPRAGHIPGAQNIPFSSLATDDLKMKSESDIAEIFKAAGVAPGGSVISYCHIGQQATMVYFAAKRLGLKARVYDGSWDQWSRKDELPIEKTPAK